VHRKLSEYHGVVFHSGGTYLNFFVLLKAHHGVVFHGGGTYLNFFVLLKTVTGNSSYGTHMPRRLCKSWVRSGKGPPPRDRFGGSGHLRGIFVLISALLAIGAHMHQNKNRTWFAILRSLYSHERPPKVLVWSHIFLGVSEVPLNRHCACCVN
jgi:hypothetical protein